MGAQCSPRCTHMRIGGMVGQFTPLSSGPGLLFCTIDDDNVRLLFFFHSSIICKPSIIAQQQTTAHSFK